MKLKFVAMVATTEPDVDGDCFSISVLESLREQAVGKNVSVNFLHTLPSNIDKAVLTDDNRLFVEGVVELDRSPLGIHQAIYAVPGYIVDENGEFDQLIEMSLTFQPSDKYLTPAQFYEIGG